MNKMIIVAIISILILILTGYICHSNGYKTGYKNGYDIGYSDGYKNANALKEREIADAIKTHSKTETKIVYQKIPYTGTDVQVKTETPKVTVSVNGKKQEIVQHSETADLAVKTETAISVKIPERRWTIGIGTDGKKPMYMLRAPIKGAVGAWVAGGSHKVMGGISVSV